VLDPRSLRLVALDAATLRVRAEHPLRGDPTAVTASPDGTRLYLAAGETFTAGSLTVLDASTLAPLATYPSGAAPADVAVSADGRTLFVANTDPTEDPDDSAVWVLDAATGTRTARLSDLVAPDRLLAGPGGGWLYVSLLGDPVLAAVDVRDLRPAGRVPMPAGLDDLAASPDGHTLYAVGGSTLTLLSPSP
jgi:DNA-binding beta-propeller fold protein YncE